MLRVLGFWAVGCRVLGFAVLECSKNTRDIKGEFSGNGQKPWALQHVSSWKKGSNQTLGSPAETTHHDFFTTGLWLWPGQMHPHPSRSDTDVVFRWEI
jgi:hypothetical protein